MPNITKRTVDALVPTERERTVWDDDIKGFGLCQGSGSSPSNARPSGRQGFFNLGVHPRIHKLPRTLAILGTAAALALTVAACSGGGSSDPMQMPDPTQTPDPTQMPDPTQTPDPGTNPTQTPDYEMLPEDLTGLDGDGFLAAMAISTLVDFMPVVVARYETDGAAATVTAGTEEFMTAVSRPVVF